MREGEHISTQSIKKRISSLEPATLFFGFVMAVLSAAICMQIVGQLGSTPNTSLIGAIFAMVVARIPVTMARRFRHLERQNYIQTIVSSAGFSAANCGFVAVAIVFVMGRADLVIPMAVGCLIGSALSIFIIGRIFDSKVFPATGSWPAGVATANTLQAGDEGGRKGFELLQGLSIGAIASFFKLPAAGVGIVFIADILAMIALGVGLIFRGYSKEIFNGFDIGSSNIAQGIMIGSGFMALIQTILVIRQGNHQQKGDDAVATTVSDRSLKRSLLGSMGLYILGAAVVAGLSGIIGEMTLAQTLLWIVFAGVSSTIVMILVGMAAMQSGWFPAFAIVTIFMTFGILIGFPPLPLAVLVGYICSVGPCFADMGFDLKTGWIIRGKSKDKAHELYGRKQQVIIEGLGVVVGISMVIIFGMMFMNNKIMPPISSVFATAIAAGANASLLQELAIWAIPGVILQFAFGKKSVGILFATGLLLNNPVYGIGILAAVVVRLIFGARFMEVRSAGLIAGDGLFGFFRNLTRVFF